MDELLELAAEIMNLDAAEASLGKGREWKEAKARYEAAVETFKSKRKSYVDAILVKGAEWSGIPDVVASELNEFEANADPSWHPAIGYTRDNLLPHLTKEAGRRPWMRDVIRWTPAALGAVAVVAYFGIRLTSGTEVTAPLETQLGLQQRASAAEKVIRYDGWMGTHVRRGGWAKGILFWPIEPSDAEIAGAGEFVSLTLEGYDVLTQREEICGDLVADFNGKLSKGQINFVDDIAEDIQRDDLKWQTPPVLTILQPIKAKFPCR